MTLDTAKLDLPIEVIDIDENREIAMEYGIRGVPALVMLDENIEVKRITGTRTVQELKDWVA